MPLDTIDWPTAFLGAIKTGVVAVPVDTLMTEDDYRFMLEDSRARALVVSEELLPKFKPAMFAMSDLARLDIGWSKVTRRPSANLLEVVRGCSASAAYIKSAIGKTIDVVAKIDAKTDARHGAAAASACPAAVRCRAPTARAGQSGGRGGRGRRQVLHA